MPTSNTHPSYRSLFVGVDTQVPLLNGAQRIYVSLDNAASTPCLKSVQEAINNFLPFYSSVHRGTGFKSQLSTHAYEQARDTMLRLVNASADEHTCIFGKNTTEAINKLAHRFPFTPSKDVVITSGMEHHSNDLPWRSVAHTVHVGLTPDGRLDEADFAAQLKNYAGRVALVAITAASNVTGFINPIHRLAEQAHVAGAQFLADCAQYAPHRAIDMRRLDDPAHLDYVTLSAHKMYAPFGTGALIGRRDTFEQGDPDMRGGGTVEIVTLDDVVWAGPPEREEAGSPNTIGAIAMAVAAEKLMVIGMDKVAQHEAKLTDYALRHLASIPSIQIYGDSDPGRSAERVGVIPLAVKGMSHFKAAAILGYEFGIGVRSGCFCAHPYILHLLKVSPAEATAVRQRMLNHDKSDMPGLIRASFGLYNELEDVEALVDALRRIAGGEIRGNYIQDRATGEYKPAGWEGYAAEFGKYFSFSARV
jgi:cysteine desulfurase/selenocysteine lyase